MAKITEPNTVANRIHEATCALLERTGIDLDHPEAEALALEAGAKKDSDHRLLIPKILKLTKQINLSP